MDKFKKDVERIKVADGLFTLALIALEEEEWDNALRFCKSIMDTSFSIEQRIAAMALEWLARKQDAKEVKSFLQRAYNYN